MFAFLVESFDLKIKLAYFKSLFVQHLIKAYNFIFGMKAMGDQLSQIM
jgi:hypothetical protein